MQRNNAQFLLGTATYTYMHTVVQYINCILYNIQHINMYSKVYTVHTQCYTTYMYHNMADMQANVTQSMSVLAFLVKASYHILVSGLPPYSQESSKLIHIGILGFQLSETSGGFRGGKGGANAPPFGGE